MIRSITACSLLSLLSILPVSAQDTRMPADSTLADTLVSRIIVGIGDASPGRPLEVIADSQWHWSDIRTLPGLFGSLPGVYQFDEGEEGRPIRAWYLGSDAGSERVTVDGIPIGSPLFGSSAFTLFPLEFVGGVEALRGPASLLMGTRWNLRTHQEASPKPRTAVRFVQSPKETNLTDGMFTQNIARSTTAHVGFQRRTSNGRFDNAAFDSWALRGRLRYNLSPLINIMGTWIYDRSSSGTNGGIDRITTTTIFDDVSAVVTEPDAYEIRTSTMLALHVLADMFRDSVSLTRLSLSSTDEEREFNRFDATVYRPATHEYAITGLTHLRLEQTLTLPFFLVRGMGQVSAESATDSTILRADDRTTGSFGASIEAQISPFIVPSFAARIDNRNGKASTSFAASLDLRVRQDLTFSGSIEDRTLMPGLRETAWKDSLVTHPATVVGSDRLASVMTRWDISPSSFIALEAFRREQKDRLFYRPDTTAFGTDIISASHQDISMTGLQLSGGITLEPFRLSGWVTMLKSEGTSITTDILPPVWARWELDWKDRVFDDQLGLQMTLRGSFYDRHTGLTTDPRTGLSVLQSSVQIGRMTRLDGFLVMDIGDAFVTLAWENIIGTNYFTMATYPMPERTFRLGVRWNFLD